MFLTGVSPRITTLRLELKSGGTGNNENGCGAYCAPFMLITIPVGGDTAHRNRTRILFFFQGIPAKGERTSIAYLSVFLRHQLTGSTFFKQIAGRKECKGQNRQAGNEYVFLFHGYDTNLSKGTQMASKNLLRCIRFMRRKVPGKIALLTTFYGLSSNKFQAIS